MAKTLTAQELALYLGCEYVLSNDISGEIFILKPEYLGENGFAPMIKPLLRQLSDMTKDEITELFKLKGLDYSEVVTRASIDDNFIQIEYKCDGELLSDWQTAKFISPKQFTYLLSHHFDLFGLISEGKALDKNSLKSNDNAKL